MKKFIIPVLAVIILGMSGYIIFYKYKISQNYCQDNNQEVGQQATFNETEIEKLFEKKKECASYKNEIMNDILTLNLVYVDSDPELTEIFYSPKRNSCLYIFEYYKLPECLTMDTDTYFEIGCQFKESQIIDFFTKEVVYSSTIYDNCFGQFMNQENIDTFTCKAVSEKSEELKN